MKLQFLVLLLYYITIISAQFRLKGVVKKRHTAYRKKDINGPKCVLNETITNDYEILSSAVSESKYIFTARVLSVKKIKRGSKPNAKVFMAYKLYIRLVMKGNIDELKSHVFSGDERTLNGAIVFVDWLRTNKCAYRLYRHSSGIFLSDGSYEEASGKGNRRLRLLNEPLPLSLYDLDRVNAALKGITDSPLCRACMEAEETAAHVLLECAVLKDMRLKTFGDINSLPEIFIKPHRVARYMEELGWFSL